MAKAVQTKRIVTVTDDLTNDEIDPNTTPTRFSLNGKRYSIYLSSENAKKLETALKPFIKGAASGTTKATADQDRTKAVRKWAQSAEGKRAVKAKGLNEVGDRGVIHADVYTLFDKAN